MMEYVPSIEVCADFMCSFLAAALINWSLISLVDLIAFILILYNVSQLGKLLSSFCLVSKLLLLLKY